MQHVITYKRESYTFHMDKRDRYDTSHAHASPRNVSFLRRIGIGDATPSINLIRSAARG